MENRVSLAVLGCAALSITACTTAELEAISAGLAQGLAEASYEANAYTAYPGGNYYSPSGFASYSGWPTYYSHGQYVGPFGCSHSGSFYTCDSDGDGYADMYGDTSDGSYASSHLRVNGMGEAFTWDTDCGCWRRNRAFDGERTERHSHYKDYDYD